MTLVDNGNLKASQLEEVKELAKTMAYIHRKPIVVCWCTTSSRFVVMASTITRINSWSKTAVPLIQYNP